MNVGEFFAPNDGQRAGIGLLREFVQMRPTMVAEAIARIVPNDEDLRAELGLEHWEWLNLLWKSDETGLLDRVALEVAGDLLELQRMVDQAAAEKTEVGFSRAKRLLGIIRTIRARPLLGFLGSRNVLPKYGFPTDVVDLRTDHLDTPSAAQQVELQRDLRIALSEYAPGGEVVAAGHIWVSGGINKPPKREWDGGYYSVCSACGRFHSERNSTAGICVACGNSLNTGRSMRGEFIRPEYGFLAAPGPRISGEARPQRIYASRVHFSDYLSSDRVQKIPPPEPQSVVVLSSGQIRIWQSYSRYGWLAIVNPGPLMRGFRVCYTCGYAEPVPQIVKGRPRGKGKPHKNPRTGADCNTFTETRHLVHEFMTDVLELHFEGLLASNPDGRLWYSVLYSLLEGASDILGIRRDDLDGTIYRYSASPIPAIVLFDNVPGGAGHVRRIADNLKDVFVAAYTRMARDCCGEDTSCYECLRNFRNQPYHELLKRNLARDFLGRLLMAANLLSLSV